MLRRFHLKLKSYTSIVQEATVVFLLFGVHGGLQAGRWLQSNSTVAAVQEESQDKRRGGVFSPFCVQLVIYSCASHKVNQPLSHPQLLLTPLSAA